MAREIAQPKVMKSKKREAQDRVLSLLARGHTVTEAIRTVGRTRQCYYDHWMKEPWFADRANALRGQAERGETPFVEFRRIYFDMPTPWHQQRIIDAIQSAPERSITMILAPPGGGKTSVMEDYFCWLLANDPNFRICLVSKTQALGKKILGRIQNRMVDRGLYGAFIDRYGPFRPEGRERNVTWNKTQMTLVRMNSGERDYSMEVLGVGGQIYGSQYDLIVFDDVQDTGNNAPATVDHLVDYFRQDVFTRITRANSTGKIVIVGTRVGPGDFYERLMNELDETAMHVVKIPALIEHPEREGTVTSYFPPTTLSDGRKLGFSLDDLERIRFVQGEEVWSRNYMQEPVSKRGQTFTDHMIEDAKDFSRSITSERPGMFTLGSLDPSLSGFASFKIASYDYERLFLLDGRNEGAVGRYEELYDMVETLSARWLPQAWIIEGNAIQKGLLRDDRLLDLSKKYGFLVLSHQTGRNKQDTTIGVASMAGAFRRGEIRIPWADDQSQATFSQLCKELKAWRPDVPTRMLRQDEVMALWFLYVHWQRARDDLAVKLSDHLRARGLPFRPTNYRYAGRQVA